MIIRKAWRSEWVLITLFLITAVASVQLSVTLPWSVIRGNIWREQSLQIFLRLPIFCLMPAFLLGLAFVRVYDVKFVADDAGLMARYGIVSLSRKVVKIRYEDIRAIEVVQSLTERVLDVGIIEISTSATGGIEIIMEGVSQPRFIQEFLLGERDRRQQEHNIGR